MVELGGEKRSGHQEYPVMIVFVDLMAGLEDFILSRLLTRNMH
jgi:hypothetical protein